MCAAQKTAPELKQYRRALKHFTIPAPRRSGTLYAVACVGNVCVFRLWEYGRQMAQLPPLSAPYRFPLR
jgi:hypothetical protein